MHQINNTPLHLSPFKIFVILISIILFINTVSAEIDSYTIRYFIPEQPITELSSITAWANNINGWNQTVLSLNAGNSATFNVTVNQSVSNVSWKVEGSEEQNTSSLQFTRYFGSVGTFNVTAQAFNANGSSNIIYTVVTVTTSGGGGTDWDFLTGTINVAGATITTNPDVGSTTGGAYSFGYVFLDGNSYWINVSKAGYTSNNTLLLFNEDHEILNINLTLIPAGNASPIITSWSNTNISDSTTSLTIESGTNITFNVTANQTMTSWTWTGATEINGSGSNESYAYHNFTSSGTVSSTGTNENGSTNTITWTITIPSEIPTSSDDNIYISKENEVMSINLSTNNIDYKIILMNKVTSQIRIVNDQIIFTTDNTLYNVNKTSGEIVAKYYFDKNVGIYDPTNNNITKVII